MKISILFAATFVMTVSLFFSQAYAQSTGIAADKQKQENLNKEKAHQAEMKKKYNSMTPEQAAEAKKQANAYKKGGYKTQPAKGTKTTTTSKSTSTSSANSTKPATSGTKPTKSGTAKPTQGKPTGTSSQSSTKAAPVMMDANGKPLNKTTPPASTGKAEASPQKATTTAKPTAVPVKK